jgi:site-specific recombinase XerD
MNLDIYHEYINEWQHWQLSGYLTGKNLSPHTIEWHRRGLEHYWKALSSLPMLSLITEDRLAWALSTISFDTVKGQCHYSQRERMYCAFRSWVKYLSRKKLISTDLLFQVAHLKPVRRMKKRPAVLTMGEYDKLQQVTTWLDVHEDYRQILKISMAVMAYAGLRRAELVSLRTEDVDFHRAQIIVQQGKGLRTRTIGINDQLMQALDAWLSYAGEHTRLVWRCAKTTGLHKINELTQQLSQQSGIHVTPHAFRRLFATRLVELGMPVAYVQRLLGHSDIKTTMSYVYDADISAIKALQGIKF